MNNELRAFYLVKKLRYRYSGNTVMQDRISHIVWYSFPVVWPSYVGDFNVFVQQDSARRQKKKRANGFLHDMFAAYNSLYFVTLTFRDDVLSSCNDKSRHRYVISFLNKYCHDYLGNVDYGGTTGREHYHVVCAFAELPSHDCWRYGFSSFKHITKTNDNDVWKMSSYILKLSNHAGKLGTGRLFRKRGMKEMDNLPF